jgi:beta-glucosidase
VHALLHAPFLGMAAGAGIADVIVGARNPSARLTLTWYANLTATLPPLGDYSALYKSTYRYADAATTAITYPFGHGLSYASFAYSALTFNATNARVCDALSVTVAVKNTGAVGGFEVVQFYGSIKGASVAPVPVRQLMAWRKVFIAAGDTAQVSVDILPSAHTVFVGDAALETVEPGSVGVWVGGGSDPAFPGVAGAAGSFDVVGDATPVREC